MRPASNPRFLALASALPAFPYTQNEILAIVRHHVLGPNWQDDPQLAGRARALAQTFDAAKVERRRYAIDMWDFYQRRHTTGERMVTYREVAPALGSEAVRAALADAESLRTVQDITDFVVVSCTGYTAPGLDILLARELGMAPTIRRTIIGHMGCFGALAGLRHSLATARAYPKATVAMLSIELSSLHFSPTENPEVLAACSLFGDGAAALLIGNERDSEEARGPEIVDMFCAADYASAEQMTWTIADEGFLMSLSPRVPITLRRNIGPVIDGLLGPHGLHPSDITHWMVHPGGPSILTVIQRQLELSDEQMALSWQILRDHGNCSSATILLILEALMKSGVPQRGEWGVMMAFGPGLTLETCLVRF